MVKWNCKYLSLILSALSFINGQSSFQGINSWYSSTTVSFGGGGILLNIQEADRQNPAFLGKTDMQNVFLDIVTYPADVNSKHLGWIIPKNKKVFSIHYRQLDYGRFDGYDEDGNPLDSYNSTDNWFNSSLSFQSGMFSYGMSAGFFYSRLAQSESVILTGTIGGMFSLEKEKFQFGFSLKNFGTVLNKYTKTEESLPTSGGLSISKKLAHLPLKLNLDAEFFVDNHQIYFLSGVFTFSPTFYLNWGLNSDKFNQQIESGITKDLITGTGIGLGFKTEKYSITTGGYFYNPGNWIFGVSFGLSY
jgi:hypothetical protein